MKIVFTGVMEIAEEDVPDDRGSIDVWLLNFIENVLKEGPETDDIYDKLNLSWEVGANE